MPPSRAMQIAVAASVTVSIADDTSGIASRIPGVSWVRTSTSFGRTSLSAGTKQDVVEGERLAQMIRPAASREISGATCALQEPARPRAAPPPLDAPLAQAVPPLRPARGAPQDLRQDLAMASACCLASGLTPGKRLEAGRARSLAPPQSPLATSAFTSS